MAIKTTKKSKIEKTCDLIAHIKLSNASFFAKIKDDGGYTVWFRALLAQILWLTFLYQISILVIPIKEFVSRNLLLVGILMVLNLIWRAIKENIPDWFDDILKGGIYYKCGLKMLNKMLLILFTMNIGVLFYNNYRREGVQK